MPKFCSHCGSPLDAGTRFCSNCGAPVEGAAAPQNPAPEQPQQAYQQPYQPPQAQAQPQQPQQPKQHVYEDAYANEKAQGMDWKNFKPKITLGKPEVTFMSKRKLIIAGIILVIILLLALLQSCSSTKGTSGTTTKPKSNTSVSVFGATKTNLLKSTNTAGVKSYTLSDVDSKTLSHEETRELDNLAREIKDMGKCQVTVIGHADNTGMADVNQAVSVNRARMVADYLRKKGVTNITSSGESYNHPVASNDTAAGRAKNRRVEIYVSTVGKYNPYK